MLLTRDNVEEATRPLAEALRADGAALVIDTVTEAAVGVSMKFGEQTCEECIMPAETLRGILSRRLTDIAGQPVEVVLNDPRSALAE